MKHFASAWPAAVPAAAFAIVAFPSTAEAVLAIALVILLVAGAVGFILGEPSTNSASIEPDLLALGEEGAWL